MGELSELTRKLVGDVMPENASLTNFTDFRCGFDGLERLVKAAYQSGWNDREDDLIAGVARVSPLRPRTEGRGEEPVAWQEAAEPFFRLAREVINPVNGERPWHADSKDWMVVFSFAGQSVTLGDLRRAAVASPIREPEISRAKRDEIAEAVQAEGRTLTREACLELQDRREDPSDAAYFIADAILNLAPVGKGAGAEPGAGWVYNSPDTGMEYSTEHPLESGEIPDATDVRRSTFFEDWMFGEIGRLDAKVRELVVNLAPVGGDPMDLPPAEQFALATKLAANVGYELTPEPEHPDSPHARHPVGGRGEEGSARADLSSASRSPDQHSAGGEG